MPGSHVMGGAGERPAAGGGGEAEARAPSSPSKRTLHHRPTLVFSTIWLSSTTSGSQTCAQRGGRGIERVSGRIARVSV